MGRLLELSRLVALAGEGKAGDEAAGEAALRKGLLEERLSCRPGDGRRSVDKGAISGQSQFRHGQRAGAVKQAIFGALPGIDGSANMMPSAW
jgi:hypothetical protein